MAIQTRLITVSGHIQGVGFRPFVYRLATELKLSGYVKNSSGIVSVHIQGQPEQLNQFEKQLIDNAPAIAKPIIENSNKIQTETFDQFEIKKSDSQDVINIPLSIAHNADPATRSLSHCPTTDLIPVLKIFHCVQTVLMNTRILMTDVSMHSH